MKLKILVRPYIRSKAEPLAKHVCLVLMYPNDNNTNHWINEIVTHLHHVQLHRLVKKAGPLPKAEIMELLFGEPLDHEIQVILAEKYAIYHMNDQEPERKLSVALLEAVYSKLCDLVCDTEVIKPDVVKTCLQGNERF